MNTLMPFIPIDGVVTRDELSSVPTPAATSTWQPIPHIEMLHQVEQALPSAGLHVVNESHELTHNANRYFGLLEVSNGTPINDHAWLIGLRSSTDKSLASGVVAGNRVIVCSNMAFDGEVKFTRKHSRFIMRDLPSLIRGSIGQLVARWHEQDHRIERYRNRLVSDTEAHDIAIRALDVGVVSGSKIPPVLAEWRRPRHEAFEPRNLWSLFNAFTEVLKKVPLADLPRRTTALYGLCDKAA